MHLGESEVRTSEPPASSPPSEPRAPHSEPGDGGGNHHGVREPGDEVAEEPRQLGGQGRWRTAGVVLIGLAMAVAVWLRFETRSALWLDEALTVNIARQPLGQIPHLLRNDGAPPLFYYLLHFWIRLFGQGNIATRSLSGVFGVLTLPAAWVAGSRIGSRWWSLDEAATDERAERVRKGRVVGWATLLLVASSPFAVYYDTEARMYALVILLSTLGVVLYTSLLRRPSVLAALGLAADTAALLYSHYWSLYLGAVVGLGTAIWAVRSPSERTRKACRYALGGLVAGGLCFLPWAPTFLFQIRHTGTPWASPAGLTAVVFTVTQFAGGNSDAGRALALIFFFLVLVGLFGVAHGRFNVLLDLRTRPGVRALALAVGATLLVAVVAGRLSGSTWADRYTSVVVVPALVIVAYGLSQLADPKLRNGILAAAVVLGFSASIPNAFISRTQGGQVGTAVSGAARPGDVVAFCPDQLGPAVSRTLHGRLHEVTFPRRTSPDIVDWVDYTKTVESARTGPFVTYLRRLAGPTHTIWYVWAPNYVGYGAKCQTIADALSRARGQHVVVRAKASDTPYEIFEGETLDRYPPAR